MQANFKLSMESHSDDLISCAKFQRNSSELGLVIKLMPSLCKVTAGKSDHMHTHNIVSTGQPW